MRWIAWANELLDIADTGDREAFAARKAQMLAQDAPVARSAIHWTKIQYSMLRDHRLFSWRSEYLRGGRCA